MKKDKQHVAGGASLVLLSSLFYGSYGVWTRLMGNGFGPFTQAAVKSLIVVGLLVCLSKPKHWQKVQWRRDGHWLIGLLAACLLVPAPLYYATNIVGIGIATVLAYAGILLGMFLFGWLFSRERYDGAKFAATCLALVGLWLVFAPSLRNFSLFPLMAAFVSGLGVALDVTITQKIPYSASQATFLTWTASVVVNLPFAIWLQQSIPHITDISWLYLLCFAVASLASSWLVVSGVKLIEAGVAGIIGLMEIVFGVAFGIIFFHERPVPLVYVGACLITLAAVFPYVRELLTGNKEDMYEGRTE